MNYKTLTYIALLFLVLGYQSIIAQPEKSDPYLEIDNKNNFAISAIGSFTNFRSSDDLNYGTNLNLLYNYGFGYTGINFNINHSLKFDIMAGNINIIIPDSITISNKAKITSRPDIFEADIPISFYSFINMNKISLFIKADILRRNDTKEFPELRHITSNIYYIDFISKKSNRTDLLISFILGFNISENYTLRAGVNNISLIKQNNDLQSDYHARLFSEFMFPLLGGQAGLSTNYSAAGISYNREIDVLFSGSQKKSEINLNYSKIFRNYNYSSFSAKLEIPVFSRLSLLLNYETQITGDSDFNKNSFIKWKNSMDRFPCNDIFNGINHSTYSLGISMEIANSKPPVTLRIVNTQIIQKNIYPAKREIYAYNPIGTIEIHNYGKYPAKFNLSVNTREDLAAYESEEYTIQPDEIKNLPLYLFLSGNTQISSPVYTQINVSLISNGQTKELAAIPMTFFDLHSWDGNTWGLKYYINPEEPAILSFAKSKYLSAMNGVTNSAAKQKYFTLQKFITEIGRGIKYISDPTSTIYVDRVQYPIETLNEKSGDCEDLTVYIATNLMAVGVGCALVDIKASPKELSFPTAGPNNIGHVFLLVDTGLKPEFSSDLELNELQFLSRKSMTGETTLWIPLECTLIESGFEAAFTEGVKEYYREVTEKDGLKKGTVHIYDQQ